MTQQESTIAHNAALLAAFGGSIEGWEYTGECIDLGRADDKAKCACGHTGLRYLFWWEHTTTGKRLCTGSTCVNTLPGLAGVTLERLERDLAAMIEAERAEAKRLREMEREAEVAAAKEAAESAVEEWKASLFPRLEPYRGRYLPETLYSEREAYYRACGRLRSAGPMKSRHGKLSRYTEVMERCARR